MSTTTLAEFTSRLLNRFGAEKVQFPSPNTEPWNAWYPLAIKHRQQARPIPMPSAIVLPRDSNEVSEFVRWANTEEITAIPFGGGSNIVGFPMGEAEKPFVAISLSRLLSISWEETDLTVNAGAGVVLADLEEMLNKHQYTLGSLPQSACIATVGGAVATESTGLFAAGFGSIRNSVLALEAVFPDGTLLQTSSTAGSTRQLHHLLIGSEAAFGIITGATLSIRPLPEVRAWSSFAFSRFEDAADALRLIYRSDARPACIQLFDAEAAKGRFAQEALPGQTVLLFCVEGSELVQTGQYQTAFAICKQIGGTETEIDGDTWFESDRFRTDTFAENARPDVIVDIFSLFCSWSTIKTLYASISGLRTNDTQLSLQIGFVNPHGAALDLRLRIEAQSPESALLSYENFKSILQEIARSHNTSIAHHYGIGQSRSAWANHEQGMDIAAILRRIKNAL